ncbi:M23 family metallopeptidase [Cohnella ginsengisoli]|uniref:M23 family metallopeptidase n=1 Tax=Cohnella ginsengisoli TaxID=425004 RepID=A0A9X4KDU3_9BACL|nr:M23 family metallopeptidase [Cohnella ginsengisoli]MDG0790193.1 M23 family metallopeptidase [Cohnella ginsengisoli]
MSAAWDGQETVPPVQGRVAETFKQNGSGVRIEAAPGSTVNAVHSGRVIQVTPSSQGDATVLVQHAGRIVTVYGGVSAASVRADDWVEAGGKLGVLGQTADGAGVRILYFAIRLGDRPLDPQEVIPFD